MILGECYLIFAAMSCGFLGMCYLSGRGGHEVTYE